MKPNLPNEMTAGYLDDDTPIRVRYDYFRGEQQWFDACAGVGSPGYDPSVTINEINMGAGWESPEVYPQLNIGALEVAVMERLAELEERDNGRREDAEYDALDRRIGPAITDPAEIAAIFAKDDA